MGTPPPHLHAVLTAPGGRQQEDAVGETPCTQLGAAVASHAGRWSQPPGRPRRRAANPRSHPLRRAEWPLRPERGLTPFNFKTTAGTVKISNPRAPRGARSFFVPSPLQSWRSGRQCSSFQKQALLARGQTRIQGEGSKATSHAPAALVTGNIPTNSSWGFTPSPSTSGTTSSHT